MLLLSDGDAALFRYASTSGACGVLVLYGLPECWLLLRLLDCVGSCHLRDDLLAAAQLWRGKCRCSTFRSLMAFKLNCRATSEYKLIARLSLWMSGLDRATNWMRIEIIGIHRRVAWNDYWLIITLTWMLWVDDTRPAFNTLSISRVLNLRHWYFHIELAYAAACCYADAGRSIVLSIHVILYAGRAVRLHTLLDGLALNLVIFELERVLHEFFCLNLLVLNRITTSLANSRRLVLAWLVRLRKVKNELMSHLLLLSQLGRAARLDRVINITAVRLPVLLWILLNILRRRHIHLRLKRQALLWNTLVRLRICIECLQHQCWLLKFLQLVFVIRLWR